MTKHLETDRLILREWKDEDRDSFARMNRDPLVMEYFPRVLDGKASGKLVDRFQSHFKKNGFGFYALELKEDGQFAGFVGLSFVDKDVPFKPAIEIAWRLDYAFWGKGYGTEASKAVLEHGFSTLGLDEIVAFAVFDNTRSIHVMKKLGMSYDKKADFHYPGLPKNHPVSKHVLYRLKKSDFQTAL